MPESISCRRGCFLAHRGPLQPHLNKQVLEIYHSRLGTSGKDTVVIFLCTLPPWYAGCRLLFSSSSTGSRRNVSFLERYKMSGSGLWPKWWRKAGDLHPSPEATSTQSPSCDSWRRWNLLSLSLSKRWKWQEPRGFVAGVRSVHYKADCILVYRGQSGDNRA